jgi:hypothetical protein
MPDSATKDDIARLAERLRNAVAELETAASAASDAAAELREVTDPESLPSGQVYEDHRELIELVTAMHLDEHAGPLRFCDREVCRAAWDMEVS